MPVLGQAKRRLGARLGSSATAGEGNQNLLCAARRPPPSLSGSPPTPGSASSGSTGSSASAWPPSRFVKDAAPGAARTAAEPANRHRRRCDASGRPGGSSPPRSDRAQSNAPRDTVSANHVTAPNATGPRPAGDSNQRTSARPPSGRPLGQLPPTHRGRLTLTEPERADSTTCWFNAGRD